jgi:hypothetical protein
VTEVLTELPLILTVQFKHCGRGQSYRPRRFDFAAFRYIAVGDRKYRLCAFTEYEGLSLEGGKFGCVFLSSSGTWNAMRRGTIESIPLAALNDFRPQLLFFTADEPNDVPETASFVRIQTEADSDEESESRVTQAQATDSFVQAVAERLRRAQREDPPDVVVVDKRSEKRERAKRPKPQVAVSNPLEMLMKSRRVHETAKWEGIEVPMDREELARPWAEAGFDEWDRQLDKGHVRKVKKKRSPPTENPFDSLPPKRSPGDFAKDPRRRKRRRRPG